MSVDRKPSKAWLWLVLPYCFIAGPAYVVLYVVATPLWFILTFPYTLVYWTPNYGLSPRDQSIVSAYLDRFATIHTNLVRAAAHAHARSGGIPEKINFWPAKTERDFLWYLNICEKEKRSTFTVTAALFATLEGFGVPRRTLWDFLAQEVESRSLVADSMKADFAAVKIRMVEHNVSDSWNAKTQRLNDIIFGWLPKIREKKHLDSMGMERIVVRSNDLSWLLRERVLLTKPGDEDPTGSEIASRLTRSAMWWPARKSEDLETGTRQCWQLVEFR